MEGRARITRSLPRVLIEPAAAFRRAITPVLAAEGRSPSGRMAMRRLVYAAEPTTVAAIVVRVLYM